MENRLIAVLGRGELPVDGVEDYCKYLGEALGRHGVKLQISRVRWDDLGWITALRKLSHECIHWRDSWVVVQYTALAWSRRGFPFGVLFALSVLRRRGIRCAVVFHEPCRQEGKRWIGSLRGRCQDWVIRRLYARATRAIFLDPLEKIGWLPPNTPNGQKASFIPIGANLPDSPPEDASIPDRDGHVKTVVVFCLSGPSNRQREISDIARAMKVVTQRGVQARVIFVGRGTADAKPEIDAAFASESTEVIQLGLKDTTELRKILSAADAMLCVRGRLYMRRGSAIAGIACGLPIVGYEGEAAGTPLEEAGIELVPYRDCDALGETLTTILTDSEKRKLLSLRSSRAQQKFFSWTQIAGSYVRTLRDDKTKLKLLLYSHAFAPSIGGIETLVVTLARGLSTQCDINVTVATQTPAAGADDRSLPFRVIRRPGALRMTQLIRRADVVHLAGPAMKPLALSFLLNKATVVEHHGFQTICPNGQLFYAPTESACPGYYMAKRYRQCIRCGYQGMGAALSAGLLVSTPIRRWLCNLAQANVAPTDWLASQLKLERQITIPHGVSTIAGGSNGPARDACRSTFAFMGRLVSTKGIQVLLKAFEELCSEGRLPRLVIIGSGPDEEVLRRESAIFGDRVQFLGEVPADQLDQALADAASIVMPSLTGEVFGLVALENMMRGKVLIVSNVGSLKEVVGNTGLIFPAGDAVALAACMRLVMDEPSRASTLACAGRRRAEQFFGDQQMVQAHVSLYRQVLASKKPSVPTRPLAEHPNGN